MNLYANSEQVLYVPSMVPSIYKFYGFQERYVSFKLKPF